MDFFLYILRCADGSLYIGHTDDLDRRMEQHDLGRGCAYTATRRPVKLIHAEAFETRYEALTMERRLKGWSRAKKLAYIAGNWSVVSALAKGMHRHERECSAALAGPSTSPAGAGYAQGERCGEDPAHAARALGERCGESRARAQCVSGDRCAERAVGAESTQDKQRKQRGEDRHSGKRDGQA
ncbi:MAG TPA: GIY-YIG nuclease family protein [Dyella sp.]|nr:GIY-YIG nuclease family protein [Dyella sp.]